MSTFTINSKELLKALNFAGKAIPNTAITPIFECVLLDVKKSGQIFITGSDSNTVIQTSATMAEWDFDEDFKIAAPYDLLSKTLINLPNAPITITYIEEGIVFKIELTFETDLFSIPCEDPRDYFKDPVVNDSETIKMPAQHFQRGIDQVINFVGDEAKENPRPFILGMHIQIQDGRIDFCAFNGFTLGLYSRPYSDPDTNKKFLVPGKFMRLISEFIGNDESDVFIQISDRMIKVRSANWVAHATLIENEFPAYRNGIPKEFLHYATVDADKLKMAIKRALPMGDPGKNTAKLTFRESNLFLSAEFADKNTRSDQDIQIESEIEDFEIGVNMKLLQKALSTVSGDFKFAFNAHNTAAMIYPDKDEEEEIQYLVMPVLLNYVPA